MGWSVVGWGGGGGGVWWDGVGVGGMGGGKNNWLGHPWSIHDAHAMLHATLVGHGGSGSNPSFPSPNQCLPLLPFFQL